MRHTCDIHTLIKDIAHNSTATQFQDPYLESELVFRWGCLTCMGVKQGIAEKQNAGSASPD